MVVAIASPTAAPEKREERPTLVICRVCARRGDGFNSSLGVKKPNQRRSKLPPNSPFAEKNPIEETAEKGRMREVFFFFFFVLCYTWAATAPSYTDTTLTEINSMKWDLQLKSSF